MDPDTTNYVLLRIHVDKKTFLALPSSGQLVEGMGVKNKKVNLATSRLLSIIPTYAVVS